MEDDKFLKKLITDGGMEDASPAFTNKVMAGLPHNDLATLTNTKNWAGIYKYAVAILVAALIALSFFVKPALIPQNITEAFTNIPTGHIITYIQYILAFWLLVAFSFLLDRRLKKARNGYV